MRSDSVCTTAANSAGIRGVAHVLNGYELEKNRNIAGLTPIRSIRSGTTAANTAGNSVVTSSPFELSLGKKRFPINSCKGKEYEKREYLGNDEVDGKEGT